MRYLCTVMLVVFTGVLPHAQDTVFVKKHTFNTPVRNVIAADNIFYVKTRDQLYRQQNDEWEELALKFDLPYVFYQDGFYEAVRIPLRHRMDLEPVAYLIPQKALTNVSYARVEDVLFISVGGSLYEYQIRDFYRHVYERHSIRDIYIDDSLKVVSTYSGIYINDSLKADKPDYSSGPFQKIEDNYYLVTDLLYKYEAPSTFVLMTQDFMEQEMKLGKFRKLVETDTATYVQLTKCIGRYDTLGSVTPIHQGFEYMDIETDGQQLIFGTTTGEIFGYKNDSTQMLFSLDAGVNDVYSVNEKLYVAADNGVYVTEGSNWQDFQKVADLQFAVAILSDLENNLWISTENGLYVIPKGGTEPIAIIPNEEFNREAFLLYDNVVYAGSINGLYLLDVGKTINDYLPTIMPKIDSPTDRRLLYFAGLAILAIIIAGILIIRRRRETHQDLASSPASNLTLAKVREDIITHKLLSVEDMAEHYQTNPVQLNRIFKTFDTTPGKFLRQVKLEHARELMIKNASMEELMTATGYSADYLRKHLKGR